MDRNPAILPRRSILRAAVLGVAAAAAAGCASARPAGSGSPPSRPAGEPAPTPTAESGVLLAYFSRAGENYHYGGRRRLKVGNTEVLAGIVGRLLGCGVHRIEAADPYPDAYEATVRRNVREQEADARPGIANPIPSLDRYDTVLLASPIWNVRAPMIMTSFVEALDLTGRTVHPVTTYAMSGLGTTEQDYAASCRGATIGEGLAVQGEEVGSARPAVESWLRRNRFIR
jgi:flavodoxin